MKLTSEPPESESSDQSMASSSFQSALNQQHPIHFVIHADRARQRIALAPALHDGDVPAAARQHERHDLADRAVADHHDVVDVFAIHDHVLTFTTARGRA